MAGLGLRGEYDLKIGRKKYLLKFGTNSTAIFCEEKEIGFQDFQDRMSNMSIMDLRDFIWAAAVAGCHTKQKEVDFDRMDVGDWIDDMADDELEQILNVIEISQDPGETKNSNGPEGT